MAVKKASKPSEKKTMASKAVNAKNAKGVTEDQVKDLIDKSMSEVISGVDELKSVVQDFMKSVHTRDEENIPSPSEVPLPPPPEPPYEETVMPSEKSVELDKKETIEVSARSLGGVINEKGIPWNMFMVSVVLAVIITAILTSMYFLNRSLELSPLEINIPDEVEYKDVTEIPTGIQGNALVFTTDDKPISWRFNAGNLYITPKAEGHYNISVTIASGSNVHTGYFQFESVEGAGDNRYALISEEVKAAIESTLPLEERSSCKDVGDNYKMVSRADVSSVDEAGMLVRDKNRVSLGFTSATPKFENESNWFNLLKSGGPISDIILKYAGVNPSKNKISRIMSAVSDGFYAVKY